MSRVWLIWTPFANLSLSVLYNIHTELVNYITATMVFQITARIVNCNTSLVLITTAICSGELRKLGAKAEKLASCGGDAGGLGPQVGSQESANSRQLEQITQMQCMIIREAIRRKNQFLFGFFFPKGGGCHVQLETF